MVESNWDPEDDASTITPLVTNICQPVDAFFVEHVRFLQVQTQPRKVEEVYHNDTKKENAIPEKIFAGTEKGDLAVE